MIRTRKHILALALLTAAAAGPALAAEDPAPHAWQEVPRYRPWMFDSGEGRRAFAALGWIVEFSEGSWPELSRRTIPWHSIHRFHQHYRPDRQRNSGFGEVRLNEDTVLSVNVLSHDWSHGTVVYKTKSGKSLTVRASRTSRPATPLFENANPAVMKRGIAIRGSCSSEPRTWLARISSPCPGM